MMGYPECTEVQWGEFSFADGLKLHKLKTLTELAKKSSNDLEHVINLLLRTNNVEAETLAEHIFDLYA